MADPCAKPQKWSKNFQVYVEKHNLYDVFQELLKKMILTKPEDPLVFIRDQCARTADGMNNPQAFMVGPNVNQIGQRLAGLVGAKFLTLEEIIHSSGQKEEFGVFSHGDNGDEAARHSLAAAVNKRLLADDCEAGGYVLCGFPQSKAQAICAQQVGCIPRQVFIFLPESVEHEHEDDDDDEEENLHAKPKVPHKSQADYAVLKDLASVYHFDICKVITHEKLMRTKRSELESELQGILITCKPSGAPFVPRVAVMGPPGSGKSAVAEFLAGKFSLVNVDYIELVRGAARWNEEGIAAEAKEFLADLKPMSEETVKTILTTRLSKPDCDRKGWVLHGFPENKRHGELLVELFLEPNRVFMLSCSQEISTSRMSKKKKAVMKRHLNNQKPAHVSEKGNILIFPFGEKSVVKRFETFTESLQGILDLYGSKVIFVDASMKPADVKSFVESSVMRPPILRKK